MKCPSILVIECGSGRLLRPDSPFLEEWMACSSSVRSLAISLLNFLPQSRGPHFSAYNPRDGGNAVNTDINPDHRSACPRHLKWTPHPGPYTSGGPRKSDSPAHRRSDRDIQVCTAAHGRRQGPVRFLSRSTVRPRATPGGVWDETRRHLPDRRPEPIAATTDGRGNHSVNRPANCFLPIRRTTLMTGLYRPNATDGRPALDQTVMASAGPLGRVVP